jgi:hypothetical protein
MGGSGSGNYYRGSSRTTCEGSKRIDIRYLKKRGWLNRYSAGSLSWSRGGEPTGNIRFIIQAGTMTLNFKCRQFSDDEWESIEQTIRFDQTTCNYGGYRHWFLCLNCSARVAILYGADALFLCRHCYRLPYASQGEGYLDRMSRKVRKLGDRLDTEQLGGIERDGYFKPKHMHWKTFHRLRRTESKAEDRMNNAFMARFGHWL